MPVTSEEQMLKCQAVSLEEGLDEDEIHRTQPCQGYVRGVEGAHIWTVIVSMRTF